MANNSIAKFNRIVCNGLWRCGCGGGCNSVAAAYPDLIYSGLLVRQELETHNTFFIFANYDQFAAYRDVQVDKCFHEVIIGPQKAKVDIDVGSPLVGSIHCDCALIATIARAVFIDLYFDQIADYCIVHNYSISNPRIVDTCVTYSRGHDSRIGYHITIKQFALHDNNDALLFTERLIRCLPLHLQPMIDAGVNNRIQNLRLIGCHKVGQPDRIKKLLYPDKDTDTDTLITLFTHRLQSRSASGAPIKIMGTTPPIPVNMTSIVAACETAMLAADRGQHVFRNVSRSITGSIYVNYTRIRPTHCAICNRTHDTDNTMVFIVANGVGDPRQLCRRRTIT